MCWTLYVGSEVEIPLAPWGSTQPAAPICVQALRAEDRRVRAHFQKPWVYEVGAYEGCGCGFQYDEICADNGETLAAKDASRQALFALLGGLLKQQHELELYVCWAGDESEPREFDRQIRVAEVTERGFSFREREYFRASP